MIILSVKKLTNIDNKLAIANQKNKNPTVKISIIVNQIYSNLIHMHSILIKFLYFSFI